jgi:4-carboxymuconolactone decarboxylase
MTTRLPLLVPGDLSDDQRDLYDTVTGKWHAISPTSESGTLEAPYSIWLHAPEVGKISHSFAVGLRDSISLSDRARELAILVVAAHPFVEFLWHGHQGRTRALGISDEQIEAIRVGGQPEVDDPVELVVVEAARALVTERDLGDELYERAIKVLGPQGLIELLALCSWYQSLALQFRVFRVPPRKTPT